MAVGKNKLASKGGKKGGKRKAVDPFLKKEWYDIKAPTMFTQRQVGKTLITRTQGTKIASEGLKGRVFEVSLADLQKDEDNAFRKIRLRVEEVQGRSCLTNFHGMTFTTDKLRSLVRKWQTLIEAYADVKTSDGYVIRLFCISFTKKRLGQVAKCCYCQSSQEKAIRRKMVEVMHREAECPMHELVSKFIPESIGREIEKECHTIYPLQSTYIRKAKLLRTPRFDITKLMELHAGNEAAAGAAAGERVDRPEGGLIPEAEERVEIEGDY